uniref:Colony stimulating factor 2 receptor subunit beta n=1 Tax=Chelonoidis abingdonii TaxID=106734 RepID=A0A8C0FZQ0_CHEAB
AGMNMKAFCMALLALCWAFRVGESRESLPMQSLRCYNDYTSQMTCTWQEYTAARLPDPCSMPCEPQGTKRLPDCQDSCVCWSCHRNSTLFAIGVHDRYTFKPNRLLQAELNFSLFQNVQPLPPQKLWINVTEAGDFLLAWEAAEGSKGSHWVYDELEFEVTYRREWESWEVVANSSHYLLRRDALVPGSTYVARVRSKPSQGAGWSGQSSEWSAAVSWKSQEGDEAQPKNLRCLFNGVDQLTCSWEVRREVTSSVLFKLFYRTPPASEETECSPVHEEELPGSHYLLHSCEINVTKPSRLSQYLITVRPKKEEKLIEAYKNIKPLAPVNVTMTKTEDQKYELRWTKQILSYDYIGQRYEFLYWKTSDSLKVGDGTAGSLGLWGMLEPSTHYRGKMRARVHLDSYKGFWSEWSEECTWETESGTSQLGYWLGLCVWWSLPTREVTLKTLSYYSKKKKWEEKIPNPGRSQLLQSYLQNPYQTLEMTTPAPHPAAPSGCHSSQGTSQSLSPASLPWRSSAKVTASQAPMSCFDFNGPYLSLPRGCSLPDIHQDLEDAPLGTRERLVSLEYVSLPEGSPSQTLLVGEERGEAQLHSVSFPVQKEMKQPLAGGQEGPQDQPAGEEVVQGDSEGQRAPIAAILNNSCQKLPSGYVTTEDLSLMPARDSAHLSPTLAPPEVIVTASVPLLPPASANLSGIESYVMFPNALSGTPEPISVPPTILSEGVDLAKPEPGQEDNVVMFNPDGTGPVFLRQVGEYCFFPSLKPGEKTPMGERDPLADQTLEARQAFGKPPCDGGSVNGKREPALHMQAIQLFKTLKCDDYFVLPPWSGQEPAFGAKELC